MGFKKTRLFKTLALKRLPVKSFFLGMCLKIIIGRIAKSLSPKRELSIYSPLDLFR